MKYLFLIFTLLSIVSCRKDVVQNKIDSDILVSADKTNSEVVIRAETVKEFGALNHQIIYNLDIKSNEILINFNDIKEPEVSLWALDAARCTIEIANLNIAYII